MAKPAMSGLSRSRMANTTVSGSSKSLGRWVYGANRLVVSDSWVRISCTTTRSGGRPETLAIWRRS